MAKFLVEQDRQKCIGCGSCAAINPKRWKMGGDGKAELISGKNNQAEISDAELKLDKETAECCPISAIHIKNKDTGEKLI